VSCGNELLAQSQFSIGCGDNEALKVAITVWDYVRVGCVFTYVNFGESDECWPDRGYEDGYIVAVQEVSDDAGEISITAIAGGIGKT